MTGFCRSARPCALPGFRGTWNVERSGRRPALTWEPVNAKATASHPGSGLRANRRRTPGCQCPCVSHLQGRPPHNIRKTHTRPSRCQNGWGTSRSGDWDARRPQCKCNGRDRPFHTSCRPHSGENHPGGGSVGAEFSSVAKEGAFPPDIDRFLLPVDVGPIRSCGPCE